MSTLKGSDQTQNSLNYQADTKEKEVIIQDWSLHDLTVLKYNKLSPSHAPMYMENHSTVCPKDDSQLSPAWNPSNNAWRCRLPPYFFEDNNISLLSLMHNKGSELKWASTLNRFHDICCLDVLGQP